MHDLEKHALFYRGYLTHDRSAVPLAIALATIVVAWLFVYLIGAIGPLPAVDPPPPAAVTQAIK